MITENMFIILNIIFAQSKFNTELHSGKEKNTFFYICNEEYFLTKRSLRITSAGDHFIKNINKCHQVIFDHYELDEKKRNLTSAPPYKVHSGYIIQAVMLMHFASSLLMYISCNSI